MYMGLKLNNTLFIKLGPSEVVTLNWSYSLRYSHYEILTSWLGRFANKPVMLL